MCLFTPYFSLHGFFCDATPPSIVRIIGSDFQISQAGRLATNLFGREILVYYRQ